MGKARSWRKLCLNGVISTTTYAMAMKSFKQRSKKSQYSEKRFDQEKYTKKECKDYFRFKKSHIKRLAKAFKLPGVGKLPSRHTFRGLEAFCILLRRLSYPNRMVDLVKMFYRPPSTLSLIFNWTLKFLHGKASSLLSNLKAAWMDDETFEGFAQVCIDAGSHYPKIVGFVDGTGRGICRPKHYQRLQYSGYKKAHVVKYQSVVYPNGIIERLDGPFNGHRHDAAILNLSGMKREMEREFDGDGWNFALYGDPGYSNQKFIKVGFKNYRKLTHAQRRFNKDMSALRVSVEYGFCKILQQFAFVDFKKNQRLYQQNLKHQYYVAAMLVNCQTCLKGNQISEYFNCAAPSLEKYLESV